MQYSQLLGARAQLAGSTVALPGVSGAALCANTNSAADLGHHQVLAASHSAAQCAQQRTAGPIVAGS